MRTIFSCFFLLIPLLFSCVSSPEEIINDQQVFIFGHRGAGVSNEFIENTFPAVKYAFEKLNGAEIDIQMSKEGTLWLWHDADFNHICNKDAIPFCIPLATDNELEILIQCREDKKDRLYKLEEIFFLFQQEDHREKFLSLDIKGFFNEDCFRGGNAGNEYFIQMAESLVGLIAKYSVEKNIIAETDHIYFLELVKERNKNISCHLLAYDNLQDKIKIAKEKGFDGISFNLSDSSLSPELIQEAHKHKIQIQLWTATDSLRLEYAKSLMPFAVQTDYLP